MKNKIYMTCKLANEIWIPYFLETFFRIFPVKDSGSQLHYLAFYRAEKTASLVFHKITNRWYDHGIGKGGKLVDLGILIFNISVREFLHKLEDAGFDNTFSFQKPTEYKKALIKHHVKDLENEKLIGYLSSRSIDLATAKRFCKEIVYVINDKTYTSIGFPNNIGGIETRNLHFKGCIGTKGITTILNQRDSFSLFEGFIDFLTAFQNGVVHHSDSFIILNSVNQIQKAILELQNHSTPRLNAYFDKDEAGKNCFRILQSKFPHAIDRSQLYEGFKDLNEMFSNNKIQNV